VARLKLPGAFYLVLAALALFTAIAVPLAIGRFGSNAVPGWTAAVSPGPLSKAHAFIGDKCESCHVPAGGIAASKCITCHASAPELLSQPATAFHANIGECRGCHVEHNPAAARPIKMDHAILAQVAAKTTGHEGSLNCFSCHATRDKHQGYFGQECASCHVVKTWKIEGYLHPSPRSTNCTQCHKAPPSHYMMHFSMMDKTIAGKERARVDQCFACHQTDSFNNIKGVGWVKMH